MFLKRHLYRSPDEDGGAPPAPAPAPEPAPAPSPAPTPSPSPAPGPTPAPAPEPAPAPAPQANKWSDTWREDMAGPLAETATAEEKTAHDKLLKRLQRLNTPAEVAKALREQDKLISSGQLRKPLAANATAEQVAAWRAENGIPESADKYDLGMKTDDLTPMSAKFVDLMKAKAHAANASPETVKAIASAIPEFEAAAAAEVETKNNAAKAETIETLRTEWGPDYKSNMDGIMSWVNAQDSSAAEALINARVDGVQILNIPAVTRMLAGYARELGYVGATVVPTGGDLGKSIEDEIATIEKSMFNADNTKNPAYWNSDKAITRYSQLLEARERRNSK